VYGGKLYTICVGTYKSQLKSWGKEERTKTNATRYNFVIYDSAYA
jgi:hypothetical protein